MAAAPRILAMAGSARRDSVNKKLLGVAVAGARQAGVEVTVVDLREYPMPVYDGDLEAESGLPEHARRLWTLFREHQGLLLACPEYNSSITPLLKNVIDWVSRPYHDQPSLAAIEGKVAALVSASPGRLGGLRGLSHVREILQNIDVMVIPDQHALGGAYGLFDEAGRLTDDKQRQAVEAVGRRLAEVLLRLHA